MHDPFKTASGVQNSGPWDRGKHQTKTKNPWCTSRGCRVPWDPWLPVVKNSRLFAQHAHSARCAPIASSHKQALVHLIPLGVQSPFSPGAKRHRPRNRHCIYRGYKTKRVSAQRPSALCSHRTGATRPRESQAKSAHWPSQPPHSLSSTDRQTVLNHMFPKGVAHILNETLY